VPGEKDGRNRVLRNLLEVENEKSRYLKKNIIKRVKNRRPSALSLRHQFHDLSVQYGREAVKLEERGEVVWW